MSAGGAHGGLDGKGVVVLAVAERAEVLDVERVEGRGVARRSGGHKVGLVEPLMPLLQLLLWQR